MVRVRVKWAEFDTGRVTNTTRFARVRSCECAHIKDLNVFFQRVHRHVGDPSLWVQWAHTVIHCILV